MDVTDGEADADAVDEGTCRVAPIGGRYVTLSPRETVCGGESKDTSKRETDAAHDDHAA